MVTICNHKQPNCFIFNKPPVKTFLLVAWLTVLTACIVSLFWYNEWRYMQPTPLPVNYHAVLPGASLDFTPYKIVKTNRPVFLHFFNPDCPCSRFNITHFKQLVNKYKNQIQFEIVVVSKNKALTAEKIRHTFSLQLPIHFDTTLATVCGVYSTPQAVIVTANHKLYYRGNYNKTRYCTDERSNYALMAIDSLLAGEDVPDLSKAASRSYGCALPKCKPQKSTL